MTRNRLRVGLMAVVLAGVAAAQQTAGRIQVLASPEHPDWKYAPGEKVTFVVRVIRDGAPVHGLKLDWSAGPEMMDPVRKGTVDLTSDSARIEGGTMEQPGFLRMIATVEEEG